MPQQAREKGKIPSAFYKVFCKPVPERVGIDNLRIQVLAESKGLQLRADAGDRDAGAQVTEK